VNKCTKFVGLRNVIFVLLWVGLTAWDFSQHSIPLDEILSGGPSKDGIPAIDRPRFVSADKASRTFLRNEDRIIALVVNGKKKAYPIKILNWHEIVNDSIGGRRVVVTFCPLCGTGMVFDANAAGRKLDGLAKAYPFSELARTKSPLKDKIGKKTMVVTYDPKSRTATIKDASGKELPSVVGFWFAWYTFHKDTQVFTASKK
jgi:hypothetical protein